MRIFVDPLARVHTVGQGVRWIGIVCAVAFVAWLPGIADSRGAPRSAIITIKSQITDITAESVRRRLDAALADGARTIIFEMDTPGGLVTSALTICRSIKNLPADVDTVAWVNHQAFSAGAMISVACRRIVMSRASSIGDCAPIMINPAGGLEELGDAERAKAESPVLQEFRDSAARNGYDALLCRAMVAVGQEVWWVEEPDTQERRFVSPAEKQRLLAGENGAKPWRLVTNYKDPLSGADVPLEQPVDGEKSLLTLSQSEAVAFGFAKAIASDASELAQVLNLPRLPMYLDVTVWETFVEWLNSPLVRGVLFMLVVVGAYMEFQHPGLILPGVTAGVALLIFLAAPYAAGLANVWTLVVLIVGAVLLAIEIFVIPGFGIVGLTGIVLILLALVGTFVPSEPGAPPFSWPQLPGTWDKLFEGIKVMTISTLVAVAGIVLLLRYLPDTWLGRRLMLATPDAAELALPDVVPAAVREGQVGIVTADLRPGGQARFGDDIVDVQSQGEYVSAGRHVQVLRREGMNVIVRPMDEGCQA